jgi:hypothetical protein
VPNYFDYYLRNETDLETFFEAISLESAIYLNTHPPDLIDELTYLSIDDGEFTTILI